MMKRILFSICLVLTIAHVNAQSFALKSVNAAKAFELMIYFGTQGKGGFVQYMEHEGIIPLQIKSHHQGTYIWDEVIAGKVTGSYGLTEKMGEVSAAWYQRKKDGKRFSLEAAVEKPGAYDDTGVYDDKYLLHGALISFNRSGGDLLTIDDADGKNKTVHLPGFDNPDYVRQGNIADYNFDGYDDIAFSIPDAGMGVYREFSILLYNPKSRRFEELPEPDYSRSRCSGLCDVSIDSKRKLLFSSCRGGANWWQDVYRFEGSKKLVWIKSDKLTD